MQEIYAAIDLKSFYASVECIERGLDPLSTNLVVADASRTDKTICLAVTPSLKSYGVPGRPRLFEVKEKVREINAQRRWSAPKRRLSGGSYDDRMLRNDPSLALDYITAPPRMQLYMDYSTKIYGIYLKYFAPEDIHVYSIDEVFIDLTHYFRTYRLSARDLITKVINDVIDRTGITATAGIGTNLYLSKVAMDIVAKRASPDERGVRIAEIDEMGYRKLLWEHRPLTDFWRIGGGYRKKLESRGMFTMGDIAQRSLENEDELYKLFGVNAELLIDHAWGYESCRMKDIKAYRPTSSSLSTGQVLSCPYVYGKAKLVLREMCELFVLDMVEKGVMTDKLVLTVGYDIENLKDDDTFYDGEINIDYYGRRVPKHAHGTVALSGFTSSAKEIVRAAIELFERIVDQRLTVRRINLAALNITRESSCRHSFSAPLQLDIFSDADDILKKEREEEKTYEREKRAQRAVIEIKNKFGKNAILKGMNFEEGATAIERNLQIGGHKA